MIWRALLALGLVIATWPLQAAPVQLRNLRMWHAPDHTQIVFDLSAPIRYTVRTLDKPKRVAVDFPQGVFRGVVPSPRLFGPIVRGIRMGHPVPGTLRVVFDLAASVSVDAEVLPPNDVYGNRLVIDLNRTAAAVSAPPPSLPRRKELIIAVDAGHGGEDFGASGPHGVHEKDVVLAIARRLHQKINSTAGMHAVFTRDNDYYISLRRRTEIARQQHADLFVSIHADSYPKLRSVRGSSVYALSQHGASSEAARWLASKENDADLAGGVSLRDKDDLLARVLLDLSMTNTINQSISFGRDVLAALRRIGPVHSSKVEQAGFVVLKSPDIPSVLVETAYISNPVEERRLNSSAYQRKLASAILAGIERYRAQHQAPTEAVLASPAG